MAAPQDLGLPVSRTGSPKEPVLVLALVSGIAWWILMHGTGRIAASPYRVSHWPNWPGWL